MSYTRVLHLSGNSYPAFPAEHHTRRIWEALARGFDEYHVLARSQPGQAPSYSVNGNIHLHLLPSMGRRMWMFFFLSWALPWFVLKYRPTHLLAQCPVMGGLAAAVCAKLFKIPLLVELHGSQYFRPVRDGWKGRLEFRLYRMLSLPAFAAANGIRTLSPHMSAELMSLYGERLRRKVVEIPTRVDLKVFSARKSNYETGPELRIISVGAFSKTKNHSALIKDLHASGIPFRLTLVGAGPLEVEYERLVQQLRIQDRITIAGRLDQVQLASQLATHDVYVHYSLSEGLSRAILEAMAVGLPVIATRVGFINGVLEDGVNAIVLDTPWASNLAGAVRALSADELLRRRLGQRACEDIEKRFEAETVFAQYRKAILGISPSKSAIARAHS